MIAYISEKMFNLNLYTLLLIIFSSSVVSCVESRSENIQTADPKVDNSSQSDLPTGDANLNEVHKGFPDFRNFEYSRSCFGGEDELFALRDGAFTDTTGGIEIFLARINYSEVTGDNIGEALVVLGESGGGTASQHCVYVFAIDDHAEKTVKLLGSFNMGDRADGGLRRVYGENGWLVIETYILEEGWGSCCSKYYSKATYIWNGDEFQLQSQSRLVNPSERADDVVEGW